MPIDASIFAKDAAFMIADMPTSFVYDGDTYSGTKTATMSDDILSDSGLREMFRFSVYSTVEPLVGDVLAIGGENFRIIKVMPDGLDQLVRIDLGEEFA